MKKSDRFDSQARRMIQRLRPHVGLQPRESEVIEDRIASALRRAYSAGLSRGTREGIRVGGAVAVAATQK